MPKTATDDVTAAAAWLCLTSSPRFANMTVADAVAEMRRNGLIPAVAQIPASKAPA